jgi:hypothetical protein
MVVSFHHVPRSARLAGAFVTSGDGIPCRGAGAVRLGREAGRGVEEPLTNGETITLGFTEGAMATLASPFPHLDLALVAADGDRRCVSLPITSGGPVAFTADERVTIGSDVLLEGFTSSLGPVSRLLGVTLQAGYWVGVTHAELGVGLIGAGCTVPTCPPPDKDSRIDYSTSVLYFAGGRRPLYERAEFSFGAALRYRAMHLAADTAVGRQTLWAHGPVIAPYVASVPTVSSLGNGLGGSKEQVLALEVPIGYAFAENGRRSPVLGVDLSLLFTAF